MVCRIVFKLKKNGKLILTNFLKIFVCMSNYLDYLFILGRDTSGFNRWRDSPRLATADPTRFFYNLIRSSFRPLT